MRENSFKNWLLEQIQAVLSKPMEPEPFILWCDPAREWKNLLQKICEDQFELWASEDHELTIRQRLASEARIPCVIWIPKQRGELNYMRVFEGQASFLEMTLLEALRDYGVEISRSQEDEVKSDLLAYALAKLDEPLSKWKKITPDELISARTVLLVLADSGYPIENHIDSEKRNLFKRRAVADFGLPEPDFDEPDKWRIRSVARLLATDAAVKLGEDGFSASDWLILPGHSRKRALELLDQWQQDLQLFPKFETLAIKADTLINLAPMIEGNNCTLCEPMASYKGEKALFQNEIEQIRTFESFSELATYLARKKESCQQHALSFWGKWTQKKVPWDILAGFGKAAHVLLENDQVERTWHNLNDAVDWYVKQGWQVDTEGEYLMQELPIEEEMLLVVQETFRKAFLQILDRTNTVFSDFMGKDPYWPGKTSLSYAGAKLKTKLDEKKDPAAVIIVDAFRFELGKRLSDIMNEGEISAVASVEPCMAPIPTTTELGMNYALPGLLETLKVDFDPEKGWVIRAEGSDQNLAIAESRRNWLTAIYGIKNSHILLVAEAIKTGFKIPQGKTIYLFGDEFDTLGHDGELAVSGAEGLLDRYAQIIRKLRDAGYGRIFLTTDHGYFHYAPKDDEIVEKPVGDILWKTRRAVVGKNLKHETAIFTKIDHSDLECLTPRSVNAFKTYGGIGFFHRGTTLEEWLIPLVCIQWAKKAQKIGVIIKPISEITSLEPVIEIEPDTRGKKNMFGEIDGSYLGRQIYVKAKEKISGKILFKSEAVSVNPKDDVRKIKLEKVSGAEGRYGEKIDLTVLDGDNEEILDTAELTLKIDMDDWI